MPDVAFGHVTRIFRSCDLMISGVLTNDAAISLWWTLAYAPAELEGSSSILHGYATATGGDVYSARTQPAMDSALSQIIVQARHQYVLSYVSNNEIVGMLAVNRKIEVKVNRPDVKVLHRRSYLQYPAPKQ